MKNVLVLYATLTGVTMDIATTLHDRLKAEMPDDTFTLANVRDLQPGDLAHYPLIIFGNSTWDHGIPSPDGEAFLQDLVIAKPDLSMVKVALFGVGDSAYPEFCGALPLVQGDLERCGATIHTEQFTIDGYPNEAVTQNLVDWAKQFLAS